MPDGEPDIKLTSMSYVVLGLVAQLKTATPYDLKRAVELTVSNFWPTPHTTLYAEPARLAGAGYLEEDQEEGGRRRKSYTITPKGRAALEQWLADEDASPPVMYDEGMLKVFFGADPEPLAARKREWHAQQLATLETYLEAVRASGDLPGAERVLVFGTALHRAMIELQSAALD
ncbi:MAG: helix-turn-helix transcriptional regulator [Solirubrobacteraceae bacterium]|nr:helix-turn-helix transcriptional regulator [Solirubrobacteraceae bacterium]